MKTKTKLLLAVATLCMAAACSPASKNLVNKDLSKGLSDKDIELLVSSTLDSLDHYRSMPPDFTLRYRDDIVRGHLGSPIHFLSDSIGEHVFLSFSPLKVTMEVLDSRTIMVLSAAFPAELPMTLEGIQQEGTLVKFNLAIAGEQKLPFELTSDYFADSPVAEYLAGGNASKALPGWWPVIKWVVEHVVLPVAADVYTF